jgi:hypothetical protein
MVEIHQRAEQKADTRTSTHRRSSRQASLEADVIARVSAGELQAFGFEGGTGAGPALIPCRYFWQPDDVDWDKETVTSLGKKFYHVRIRGEHEPEEAYTMAPEPVDFTQIQVPTDSLGEIQSSESGSSNDPPDQEVGHSDAETQKPRMGRPPVLPMVRMVIRELIDCNSFRKLSKKQIEARVRDEAHTRFPDLFRSSSQPARNTIYRALKLEGWPQR